MHMRGVQTGVLHTFASLFPRKFIRPRVYRHGSLLCLEKLRPSLEYVMVPDLLGMETVSTDVYFFTTAHFLWEEHD